MMTAEAVKIYTLQVDDDGHIIGETQDGPQGDAAEALHEKARAYVVDHRVDYLTALYAVMEHPENSDLVHSYFEQDKPREGSGLIDPSEAAHQKALALMDRESCLSYSNAVARVFKEDQTMARAYGSFTGIRG